MYTTDVQKVYTGLSAINLLHIAVERGSFRVAMLAEHLVDKALLLGRDSMPTAGRRRHFRPVRLLRRSPAHRDIGHSVGLVRLHATLHADPVENYHRAQIIVNSAIECPLSSAKDTHSQNPCRRSAAIRVWDMASLASLV